MLPELPEDPSTTKMSWYVLQTPLANHHGIVDGQIQIISGRIAEVIQ